MSANPLIKPVVLIILDGWGVAPPSRGNAITQSATPVYKKLITTYPTVTVQAAGESVGLPWGEMGNSEVGHLAIGSGKILYQDLPRITRAILNKSFFTNQALVDICTKVKAAGSALHILGLVSNGGVHSSVEHLYATLELAKAQGVNNVFVHAILDGRDVVFNSGQNFIHELEANLQKIGVGKIASVCGRFYAMDRDNHWDRIQAAYQAMANGVGKSAESANAAITASYEARVYDEELVPTVITLGGSPIGKIQNGDGIIFFNFRSDRARQLTYAFTKSEFDKWPRPKLELAGFVTMTEYEKGLEVAVAFPPEVVDWPLARVLSEAGLKQLHLAETEKYAHVTYFFNGGREQVYPGEDHILVPSPVVSSYDQKPLMSARGITDKLLHELSLNSYDFYVLNYANADMVGHTGNLPATVKAVEFLDQCLGEVVAATLEVGGAVFITADHGNAEGMINNQTGEIDKEHSNTPVPFIMIARELEGKTISSSHTSEDLSRLTPSGVLSDVAPTILKVMGLPKPAEMTGQSLL